MFCILLAKGCAARFRNDDRKDNRDRRYQISSYVQRGGTRTGTSQDIFKFL